MLDEGDGGGVDDGYIEEAERIFFKQRIDTCDKLLFLERMRSNMLNAKTTFHARNVFLQEIDKAISLVITFRDDDHETVWNLLKAYSAIMLMLTVEDGFAENFGLYKKQKGDAE